MSTLALVILVLVAAVSLWQQWQQRALWKELHEAEERVRRAFDAAAAAVKQADDLLATVVGRLDQPHRVQHDVSDRVVELVRAWRDRTQPETEPATQFRPPSRDEEMRAQVEADAVRTGMEVLRAQYLAAGINRTEDELRTEATAALAATGVDEVANYLFGGLA